MWKGAEKIVNDCAFRLPTVLT